MAMGEQTRASDQMLQNSESALELCKLVYHSVDEQRETGRYISQAISQITEMIHLIKENTAEHGRSSESVNDAVMRLLENAQKSGEQIPQVNAMLTELRDSAGAIVAELSRFELVPGDFGTDATPDRLELGGRPVPPLGPLDCLEGNDQSGAIRQLVS